MGVDRLDAQLQLPILTLSPAGRALHLSASSPGQGYVRTRSPAAGTVRDGPVTRPRWTSHTSDFHGESIHSLSFAKKAAAFFNMGLRGFVWVENCISGFWRKECRHDLLLEIFLVAIAVGASLAEHGFCSLTASTRRRRRSISATAKSGTACPHPRRNNARCSASCSLSQSRCSTCSTAAPRTVDAPTLVFQRSDQRQVAELACHSAPGTVARRERSSRTACAAALSLLGPAG